MKNNFKSLKTENFYTINPDKENNDLVYTQGKNIIKTKIEGPYPKNNRNSRLSLRIFINNKSDKNEIKLKSYEQKIKNILNEIIYVKDYPNSELSIYLTLMSLDQETIFSTFLNSIFFGLITNGLKLKSIFFALDFFFNDNKIFFKNQSIIEQKPLSIVFDVNTGDFLNIESNIIDIDVFMIIIKEIKNLIEPVVSMYKNYLKNFNDVRITFE